MAQLAPLKDRTWKLVVLLASQGESFTKPTRFAGNPVRSFSGLAHPGLPFAETYFLNGWPDARGIEATRSTGEYLAHGQSWRSRTGWVGRGT